MSSGRLRESAGSDSACEGVMVDAGAIRRNYKYPEDCNMFTYGDLKKEIPYDCEMVKPPSDFPCPLPLFTPIPADSEVVIGFASASRWIPRMFSTSFLQPTVVFGTFLMRGCKHRKPNVSACCRMQICLQNVVIVRMQTSM